MLSGFVAASTTCTLLIDYKNLYDEEFGTLTGGLLFISTVYAVYGMWISIYLYGRKIDYLKQDQETLEGAFDGVKYGLDADFVDDDNDKSELSEF